MNEGITRSEAAEEAFAKMQAVTAQIEISLRAALTEKGISLGGLILLKILFAREGPTTATELADRMMVTNGAITWVMDKLEAAGLITRTRMPMDRRVVLVEPTEKARAKFEKLRFVATEEIDLRFHGWEADDIKRLRDLLNRLIVRNNDARPSLQGPNGTSH